jgi:hypothetical protein
MSPCVNWVVLLFLLGKSSVVRPSVLAFSRLIIFPFFSLLIETILNISSSGSSRIMAMRLNSGRRRFSWYACKQIPSY